MTEQTVDLAVIGGTGVYQLGAVTAEREWRAETPYGSPSDPLMIGTWRDRRVAFLARHGRDHRFLPHQINYRANVHAVGQLRPRAVVAIHTVGSLNASMPPSSVVLPDQIIDYTWGRESSFAGEQGTLAERHADFTEPFDSDLRERLQAVDDLLAASTGTYACTQGPRFETAAEVRRLGRDGGDLVGMTIMPEAVLARELGLPYVSLSVVANWAAGFSEEQGEITIDEVMVHVREGNETVVRILESLLQPDP